MTTFPYSGAVKALLLLAGRSTRFWPLTEKTLFPVCGKTLLQHQVERLKEGGCLEVVLVGGEHNLEEAKKIYPDLEMIEQEDLTLGMRGALLSALPSCGNDPVMIVSGNDVIDPQGYAELIKESKNVDGALLAQKVETYFPGGYIEVDGDRITSIVEKPGEGNEPSDLVNIVAHVHNKPSDLLEILKNMNADADGAYEEALAALFKTHHYKGVAFNGFWQPVKYPWHLLMLLEQLLSEIPQQSIDPSAQIHPSAVIDGPVVIGPNVKVLAHSTIKGPCTIGARSVIANNALVRNSSVGEDCVIGYNTEVKGAVLRNHVWTHMAYVGDSVVGQNVSFGGGAKTGNLRLDEGEVIIKTESGTLATGLTKCGSFIGNDCRIGIQVGINPGTLIGGGTFIAGGVFLTENVPDKMFVRMKDGQLKMSENKTSAPQPENRSQYKSTLK